MQSLSHLVRDYWDAGIVAASGVILSHAGNQFYSNLFGESYASLSIEQKLQIAGAGVFVSMIGAGIRDSGGIKDYLRNLLRMNSHSDGSSTTRNFYLGLGAILIGIDLGAEGSFLEEALMKTVDAICLYGFIIMDRSRIRNASNVNSEALRSNVASEN